MNLKHKKKLTLVLSLVILLSLAAGLILYALKQNINLFYTPTELLAATVSPQQNLRLGGYVKKASVQYDSSGSSVNFIITDRVHEIAVKYHGVLPNLFREGQAVVVTGKLLNSHFLQAEQVLAKHDEKYMPKSLNKALNKVRT
jgi:cytochrome c-type biogenesis protein CcmE